MMDRRILKKRLKILEPKLLILLGKTIWELTNNVFLNIVLIQPNS